MKFSTTRFFWVGNTATPVCGVVTLAAHGRPGYPGVAPERGEGGMTLYKV